MSIHKKRNHLPEIRLNALSYAARVWEAMDTPVSLGAALRCKYGEHAQLVRMSVDPFDYVDSYSFFKDYQSVKILSKYPYLDTGIDTEAVAKEKFVWAEDLCKRTNHRFRLREAGHLFDTRVERILSNAQRKISLILGDVPSLEKLDFSFGPGAAYGVRRETSVFNKVTADLECTYVFADKLQEFLEEFPGWFPEGFHSVKLVPGSQLTFVLKDAKTMRPICIEPLLNGLYQKGAGSYLRKRLRSVGINLDDQSVNQKLAEMAIVWKLATADFTSASDTFAYLLVMNLLPYEWFEFLDVARCPRYQIGNEWKNFHKFTSMGNAYTFELETLVFFALASACTEELGIEVKVGENLSVYGDDVIIPQEAFDLFSEVTKCCGFELNEEKSFSKGVFFESCGHDYFNGDLVRPFLVKKRLNSLLPAFYAINTTKRIANRIPLETKRHGLSPMGDRERTVDHLRDLHSWCVGRVPKRFRALGPEGYGDGHIIAGFDASRPSRDRTWDGWWFRTYAERALKVRKDNWPMAYALYYTRHQGIDSSPDDRYKGPSWGDFYKAPEPLDNGSGYTVRGKTRVVFSKVFCHGAWQDIAFDKENQYV